MFFKAAHRDAAERPIIDALKAAGASVCPISSKDIPDLLVGYRGQTFLLEVKSRLTNTKKDGYTRTTTTKVSKGQQDFMDTWKGGQVRVVITPEEALAAIGAVVEGVLEPLTPSDAWKRPVRDLLTPEQQKIYDRPMKGHVVTPAYQKAQTEAVVPRVFRCRDCPYETASVSEAHTHGVLMEHCVDRIVRKAPAVPKPETYDSVFGPASEPPKKRRKP